MGNIFHKHSVRHLPKYCLQIVRYYFSYGKINRHLFHLSSAGGAAAPASPCPRIDRQITTYRQPSYDPVSIFTVTSRALLHETEFKIVSAEIYPCENGRPLQGLSSSLLVSHISCVSGSLFYVLINVSINYNISWNACDITGLQRIIEHNVLRSLSTKYEDSRTLQEELFYCCLCYKIGAVEP